MKSMLFLLAVLLLFSTSCAVKRPLFSPHRSDNPDHRQAKTIADCLSCHANKMPHAQDRGDCFKCHRILLGG